MSSMPPLPPPRERCMARWRTITAVIAKSERKSMTLASAFSAGVGAPRAFE